MNKYAGVVIIVIVLAFTIGFQVGYSTSITGSLITSDDSTPYSQCDSCCPTDITPYSQCNSCCSAPNPPASGCIEITNFHYDASGNDNYNLNNEYVTFRNKCPYSIDITAWTIRDDTSLSSHIYRLPTFVFRAGASFTLYTGSGTDTSSSLYWDRTSGSYAAIWNNDGDTLFLRDSSNRAVLSQGY